MRMHAEPPPHSHRGIHIHMNLNSIPRARGARFKFEDAAGRRRSDGATRIQGSLTKAGGDRVAGDAGDAATAAEDAGDADTDAYMYASSAAYAAGAAAATPAVVWLHVERPGVALLLQPHGLMQGLDASG